ncbi:hypothetical protein C8A00DRAFT_13071 [Chaetomidium leptoderma]|uniref:Translation initiation factor 3 N-terminal domain-containing protein n=1 Tax=Chaetomidium leptoderma TaxID=669021 RepID=A0AAN6ZXS7_9PEZI|nr:hypothetical protein C8A00DRAFT_13071 [Chaetomidium leptoderma]
MKASKCLFNSAIALRKVFINNAVALEGPGQLQLQRLLLPSITIPLQPPSSSSSSRRPFSTYRAAQNRHYGPRPGTAPPVADRVLRDHDIVFPWVQLRQDDGKLTEPQKTSAVLKKINMARQTLVLLAVPRTDPSYKGPQYPICRVADRKAEVEAQAEKEAIKKKAPKIVTKELELNWAMAPHDLRTKTTQLKKFLTKGYHVKVTMLNLKKRNKRRASADEAKEALRVLLAAVAEVPGAKETKAREGDVGGTLLLDLHAPTGSAAGAATEAGTTEASTTEAPAGQAAATNSAAEKPGVSEE